MLKFKSYEELFENEALKKKSAKSGVSYGTLKKVFNRGMAAWKSGHRPGTTPQQWGHARVNSYITKGKGTYYGADSDLSGKGKKKDKKESYVSYAQQKAAHASMADKKKKTESVDEAHDPKHVKQAIGIASDSRYAKGNMTGAVKAMNKLSPGIHKHPQVAAVLKKQNEALDKKDTSTVMKVIKGLKGAVKAHSGQVKSLTKDIKDNVQVKEISKNLAKSYMGKAARDMYHKGQDQGNKDAISRLGGPDQDYMKSPERKASMRVRGIDRATNRLMKKEAMSDAEKKAHDAAIAAFKAKGGKVKKLKPGYAQGYHGKADPAAGIKGMIDKGDTKFMSKKKVGSMK